MAITQTARYGLKQYSAGSDPHPNRVEFNAMIQSLEDQGARAASGPIASRPAAGKRDSLYYATDARQLYYDTGSGWVEAAGLGGADPAAVAAGGTAAEGTSVRAARADHVHPLAMASDARPGAMSAADFTKLRQSTALATGLTLAFRDASGRAQFSTPSAASDAATKGYVDNSITSQKHNAADVVSGTFNPARIPVATETAHGAVPNDLFMRLRDASMTLTPSVIAMRDANGNINAATPSNDTHVATKAWVDGHEWDASKITSGRLATDRMASDVVVPGVLQGTSSEWDYGGSVRVVGPSTRMVITDNTVGSQDLDGTPRKMYLVLPRVYAALDQALLSPTDLDAVMTRRALVATKTKVFTLGSGVGKYGIAFKNSGGWYGTAATFYVGHDSVSMRAAMTFSEADKVGSGSSNVAGSAEIAQLSGDIMNYLPPMQWTATQNGSNAQTFLFTVRTDGSLTIERYSGKQNANVWLNIAITWPLA